MKASLSTDQTGQLQHPNSLLLKDNNGSSGEFVSIMELQGSSREEHP